MNHSDIVVELENYVGSAKAVRIMADAAAEINRLRDETERQYAQLEKLQSTGNALWAILHGALTFEETNLNDPSTRVYVKGCMDLFGKASNG